MKIVLYTALLLILSNIFMTFAWYMHLKNLNSQPIFFVILISWGIAFFEYLLQVPANRIGHSFFICLAVKNFTGVYCLVSFYPIFSIFF